ncbi:MAG: TetR/AcrR family transcriptional regulator [Spirochaetales bacterium]|nr:TetR/AcrR family transcriptional regulator [Spirochaetales bacterium]
MARTPDEEKRRRILQVGAETFGKLGYKATTIQVIAREVGIAPGSVYTYFTDKETLFRASIDQIWNDFLDKFHEHFSQEGVPYVERAHRIFDAAEVFLRHSRQLLRGIDICPDRRALIRRNLERVSWALLPFSEEGRAWGLGLSDAEPETAHCQICLLLSGFLWHLALSEDKDFETELAKIRRAYFERLKGGLG